jgi:hypothetical protein
MSEEQRGNPVVPHCERCGTQMEEIMKIPARGRFSALVAYECPKCQRVPTVFREQNA